MKHILLLSTGGTISCRESISGLAPQQDGGQLLHAVCVPEDVHVTVCDLMCVDSTDVTNAQRLEMAKTLWKYREEYDGFVLTHGTDTMAYTAAFLCRVLWHFNRPVILTGSQLPIEAEGSDAPKNLSDALLCAASDYRGIAICFAGKLHRGSRVTKTDAHEFDAFSGGNTECPPDGIVENGVLHIDHMPELEEPEWVEPVPTNTAVQIITPLLTAQDVLSYCGRDALLLYGYGVGGVPEELADAVEQVIASGTLVYLGTQCSFGRADASVYAVGRRMQALGVRCLGAMTMEDAIACVQCGLL